MRIINWIYIVFCNDNLPMPHDGDLMQYQFIVRTMKPLSNQQRNPNQLMDFMKLQFLKFISNIVGWILLHPS